MRFCAKLKGQIMAVVYNEFKRAMMANEIDLINDTIKLLLVMTDTTIDTENDGIAFLSDFTDLDEFDGTGYTRKTLTGKTAAKNDASDRAEFSANNAYFIGMGTASRAIAGALVYYHAGVDAVNIPICYLDFSALASVADLGIKFDGASSNGNILRAA